MNGVEVVGEANVGVGERENGEGDGESDGEQEEGGTRNGEVEEKRVEVGAVDGVEEVRDDGVDEDRGDGIGGTGYGGGRE